MKFSRRNKTLKRVTEALAILLLFAMVIAARFYLFDIYHVPSGSMQPTLLPGDYILVSKSSYGPRVLNVTRSLFRQEIEYQWHRNSKKPEINDIIVFNRPKYGLASSEVTSTLGLIMVKRIIAIPGDTVRIIRTDMERAYSDVFPFDTALHWRVDNYGPLYVPRKGDSIELSIPSKKHYETVIQFERVLPGRHDSLDSIMIKECSYYVFHRDYYFVAGDNFYMSSDSRHWGFLPDTHIIGKAVVVLFSVDKTKSWFDRFRWERFMKRLK